MSEDPLPVPTPPLASASFLQGRLPSGEAAQPGGRQYRQSWGRVAPGGGGVFSYPSPELALSSLGVKLSSSSLFFYS